MHSLIDWTWYVPGNACVALICAGWLAGRGPLTAPRPAAQATGARSTRHAASGGEASALRSAGWRGWARGVGPTRGALAAAAILAALLAAWSQWQPQRSEDARQEALNLLASRPVAAEAAAERAVSRDPLSAEALFALGEVQSVRGAPARARATLEKAVRLQPSNPKTWLALGRFELGAGRPAAALSALRATIYLDPESIAPENITPPASQREGIEIYNDYIEALRATQAPARVKSGSGRRAGAAAGARRGARRRSAARHTGSRSPRSAG